jgi:hypothetical protein
MSSLPALKGRPQVEVGIPPMPLPLMACGQPSGPVVEPNRCPASINLQGLVRRVNETVL